MLDDAGNVPRDSTVTADVAVVGAGAAGITVARAMRRDGRRVVVLEGGLADLDDAHQDLYDGTAVGRDYDLLFSRLRQLGGSTNHWGGYCRPLDPLDFERRAWVPHDAGWPVPRDELRPWYDLAAQVCELVGPVPDLLSDWRSVVDGGDDPLLVDDSDAVTSSVHQLSPPTRFGERYREDLSAPPGDELVVLVGANATALRCAHSGLAGEATVDRIDVATLDGHRFVVEAPVVVLATGGIEVPRVMLSSAAEVIDPLPLPNDLVGRYFSDHLEGTVGKLVTARPVSAMYTAVLLAMAQVVLRPSDEASAVEGLLATAFSLRRHDPDGPGVAPRGSDVAALVGAAGPLLSGDDGPHVVDVLVSIETEPDPDSRVTLGDEIDALGMRRARLDWRIPERTTTSLHRALEVVGDDLAARGVGRVRHLRPPETDLRVGWHHMGTTRMHPDPAHGVVDEHCKVHGVANLWVAGSSVFPSAGSANPTLTVVALAARLAAHLDEHLSGSGAAGGGVR